ncbi:MAG: hypothetical protein IJW40_06120 [Clostridia bacterium]|nr:hypothetical protein [Clostridia bacterium]
MTDPLAYEKAHFSRIAEEHLRRSALAAAAGESGIGTLNEKHLHAILKDYMCEDRARQEVRLDDHIITGRYPIRDDKIIKRDADRYVADILTEADEIIEIQTGSFYPLVKKLDFYLRMTDCRVTVVHPIAAQKWLRYLDGNSGELSARRRSPKHEGVKDIAHELYWLAPYLAEPRFSLQLELLEVEEIRMTGVKKYRGRHRSERYDCIPLALLDEIVLTCPEDYAEHFLPDESVLPSPISAADFSRATGIRGRAVYGILGILCDLGFLRVMDKEEIKARGRRWARL